MKRQTRLTKEHREQLQELSMNWTPGKLGTACPPQQDLPLKKHCTLKTPEIPRAPARKRNMQQEKEKGGKRASDYNVLVGYLSELLAL